MTFQVEITGQRCATVNGIYGRMSRWERAKVVKWWRSMARAKCPPKGRLRIDGPVVVLSTPLVSNTQHMQDTAAALPAAKAALDGIVDAGVLPGDGPDVVVFHGFLAPEVGEVDGLRLQIRRVPCSVEVSLPPSSPSG